MFGSVKKNHIRTALVFAAAPWLLGVSCPGGTVTAPATAIALDGTYTITSVSGDLSQIGSTPTLVIAGGLLTMLGDTALTPASINVTGTNYVWVSNASITVQGLPFPLTTSVTLNATLQPDNTLIGTITLAALGQAAAPIDVTLTKQ